MGGIRTYVNSTGKIPTAGGSEQDRKRDAPSRSEPHTLPTELFRPGGETGLRREGTGERRN